MGGLGKKNPLEAIRTTPFGPLLGPIFGAFWGHVGVKMASIAILDGGLFDITLLTAFGRDFSAILEGF